MAETLGSLVDKLSIVKLKQWHSPETLILTSLSEQEKDLQDEIDAYVLDAKSGNIPKRRLIFPSNKVYKKEGNEVFPIEGRIGSIISQLAQVNCQIWHEQEKVYDFERIPVKEKNHVVKNLARYNLERNFCIDEINKQFSISLMELGYQPVIEGEPCI